MGQPIATPYNAELNKVKDRAQLAADLEKKPMAVLNLNQYSPLYVIRDWDERMAGSRQLVCKIEPRA